MGSLGAPRTQTHGVGLVIAPWARGVLGVCLGCAEGVGGAEQNVLSAEAGGEAGEE